MLAETSLERRTILMRLTEGGQLTPAFKALNPNTKIPVIVNHDTSRKPISVFEHWLDVKTSLCKTIQLWI